MKKNKEKNNKAQQKLPHKRNIFLIVIKIIMIILTVIFPIAMVIPAGAGLIYNGDSYGASLIHTGVSLIVSGVLMTAGAVLVCFRKNIISLICSCSGFAECMIMLVKLVKHANSAGWSDAYTMEPVSDMYIARILPTAAPFILAVIAALMQFFSFEASQKRREKKRLKEEKENQPAPPII